MNLRILKIQLERDADIVLARQRTRQLANLFGLDVQAQTRLATAVSEIARNAIEHGRGGAAEFALVGGTAPQLLEIKISDRGPGIPAPDGVREINRAPHSGLGIGLAGAERLVDRFSISTELNQGAVVTLSKLLPDGAPLIDKARVQRIVSDLASVTPDGQAEELKQQNRELLMSLEDLRLQREALAGANRELEDTNRGVVALYAELDEKAEHLRRADEIKTRFLSNMSHEFRTPLNSILALCKFLESKSDGPLTPEQERQVGFIRKSAESLSDLVEDLLDLAKVAAGKIVVRPSEFKIAELFGALRGMLRPLLVNQRIELIFEPVHDIPPVCGDENKISQILRNFISNALKFTEKGEVRVSANYNEELDQITLTVADTGIGIPAEHHARIFEEFSQVDSPIQRKVKGTGLGLPLSKRLAELLGGSIELESSPGEGSKFSVRIPLRYAATEPQADTEPPKIEADLIPVLAVEDNPADMAVLAACLRGTPYQIVEASSIAQARRLLISTRPAALLLDVVVGNEQSWRLLAELRHAPEMRGVPVIMISALSDPAKAAALGADLWTKKPVDREWLLAQLNEMIAGRKRRQVLVIDDDEVSRYVMRQHLATADAEVIEASCGAAGLARAIESRPDAILLDLKMPDLDGFSVLDELKRDERTNGVRVAIVTASAVSQTDVARLRHASAIFKKAELSPERLRAFVDDSESGSGRQ